MGQPLLAPTRGLLLAGCVSLWAMRLGGYLFYRVLQVWGWLWAARQGDACNVSSSLRQVQLLCAPVAAVQQQLSRPGLPNAPAAQLQHRLPYALLPFPYSPAGWQGCPAGPVFPAARRAPAHRGQQVRGHPALHLLLSMLPLLLPMQLAGPTSLLPHPAG